MNGFYKFEDGNLLFAVEKVVAPTYTLEVEHYAEYQLPIDGWFYFESEDEAKAWFGITN